MFGSRERVAEFGNLAVHFEAPCTNPAFDFAARTVPGGRQNFLNTLSQ